MITYTANPEEDSGKTLTAKVYDSAGVQRGGTVTLTEVGATAIYTGTMPAAFADQYIVRIFEGSTYLDQGMINWDGAKSVSISDLHDRLSVDKDCVVFDNNRIVFTTELNSARVIQFRFYELVNGIQVASMTSSTVGGGTPTQVHRSVPSTLSTPGYYSMRVFDVSGTALSELLRLSIYWDGSIFHHASDYKIIEASLTESGVQSALDSYTNKDSYKATVGNLATQASVNALNNISASDVAAELSTYDAPTKAELDAAVTTIVNAMSTDQMTAAELHAALDSYSNKDDFKADVSALETEASAAARAATNQTEHDTTQASIAALPTPLTAAEVNAEVDTALADYDAPTKAELDSAESNVIAAMQTDEMTESELHSALDSYSNKDSFKADLSALETKAQADARQTQTQNSISNIPGVNDIAYAVETALLNDNDANNFCLKLYTYFTELNRADAFKADVSAIPTTPAPTVAEIEGALLNEGDGQQLIDAIVSAIGNTNIDQALLVAAIRADLERVGGMLDSVPSVADMEASTVLAKVSDVVAVGNLVNALNDISSSEIQTLLDSLNDLSSQDINNVLSSYGTATSSVVTGSEAAVLNAINNLPASVTAAEVWAYINNSPVPDSTLETLKKIITNTNLIPAAL